MNGIDRRIIALAIPALGSLAVEPRLRARRHGDRRPARHRRSSPGWPSPRPCCRSCSPVPTSSPTARPSGSPVGSVPGDADEAADVGVQAMWLSLLVGVPAAPLLVVLAPRRCAGARCRRRGARPRRHLPAASARRRAVLPGHARRPGRAARAPRDYITPLRILFVANVVNLLLELLFVLRARPGRGRLGVVDRDRPDRSRRSRSS